MNNLLSSNFPESYSARQAPEEGWRLQWLKSWDNNKDKSISLNVNIDDIN